MLDHIFISYSHNDGEYALKLAKALEEKGFSVWIDERIDYGTRWPRVIQKNIDECAAFVVIMTPRSYDSDWVQNELSYATGKGKPIFPLLLEGEAWLSVAAVQYVNIRGGKLPPTDFYQRLEDVVPLGPTQEAKWVKPTPTLKPALTASKPGVLTITDPIHLELVRIPAGEFLMGSDPKNDKYAEDNEQPQHRVFVSEFYIGKYPVTNRQYMTFVEATGHNAPRHWKGKKIPSGKEKHPVVFVKWQDGMDFCEWLQAETSKIFRFPTEAEWEKAARGTDGRIYPWENKWDKTRCNTKEGGPGETTPVGKYSPRGDSPYSVADIAGNVWEWCADWFDEKEYKKRKGAMVKDPQGPKQGIIFSVRVIRALRGGAWSGPHRLARCADRIRGRPDRRDDYIGFRVVVSPS